MTHPVDAVTAVNVSSHTGVHVSPCARGKTQSLPVPFWGGADTEHEPGDSENWKTVTDPASLCGSTRCLYAPMTTVLPSIDTL